MKTKSVMKYIFIYIKEKTEKNAEVNDKNGLDE